MMMNLVVLYLNRTWRTKNRSPEFKVFRPLSTKIMRTSSVKVKSKCLSPPRQFLAGEDCPLSDYDSCKEGNSSTAFTHNLQQQLDQ